jgi:hypothetical protein
MKRMEEDPLKETLDVVMPIGDGQATASMDEVPTAVPSGVEDILDELSKDAGVKSVTLGRRVKEQRTVSQVSL